MAKKKKADPVAKAKKELLDTHGDMREETRLAVEDALARTVAARDAAKSQERLAKAADKEARLRGKELESVLKAAKAEARAKNKSDNADRRRKKAGKETSDRPMRCAETPGPSAQPPIG
jgi:hypothetical protein